MASREHEPLENILDKIDDAVDQNETDLKSVLNAFGDRAFGPILTLCGMILLTPLGAIPGAPLFLCIVIMSFSLQIILGRSKPWMPDKLNEFEITRENIDQTQKYIKPVFRKLDSLVYPRFQWAASKSFRLIMAVVSFVLAICLLPLGMVPFGVIIPGLIITLMGIGLMARDGLIILVSLSLAGLIIISMATLLFS